MSLVSFFVAAIAVAGNSDSIILSASSRLSSLFFISSSSLRIRFHSYIYSLYRRNLI